MSDTSLRTTLGLAERVRAGLKSADKIIREMPKDERDYMPCSEWDIVESEVLKALAAHPVEGGAQIKHTVERFLAWKLPENFNPDGGISFKRIRNEATPHPAKNEPVGTNLFDFTQAQEMVRYMVEDMPSAPPQPEGERERALRDVLKHASQHPYNDNLRAWIASELAALAAPRSASKEESNDR